jgi:hypothetical protein
VLTIIVLVVNQLMVSVRNAVSISQAAIRAEADTRVVFRQIRDDLAGLSKDGFLAITHRDLRYTRYKPPSQGTHVAFTPQLVFTAVRPSQSLLSEDSGNAALVQYGLGALGHKVHTNETAGEVGDDAHMHVLFRRAMVLDPSAGPGVTNDIGGLSLADFQRNYNLTFVILNQWLHGQPPASGYLYTYPDGTGPHPFPIITNPPVISLPPDTVKKIRETWPLVIDSVCAEGNSLVGGQYLWTQPGLSIEWTDGQVDAEGALEWYGPDNPRDEQWQTHKVGPPFDYDVQGKPGQDYPEHLPVIPINTRTTSETLYQAMWSYRNPTNWPLALRIRLRIGYPARDYESVIYLEP